MKKVIFGDFLLLVGSVYSLFLFIAIPMWGLDIIFSDKTAEDEVLQITIYIFTLISWAALILSLIALRIFFEKKHKLTILFGVCYLAMWAYIAIGERVGEDRFIMLGFGHLLIVTLLTHHVWHVKRKD